MLYCVDSGKFVERLPHKKSYDAWRKNISDEDYEAVCEVLVRRFKGDRIHTSSWIPGNDWTNTVYNSIYRACKNNAECAGLFFGLIVFKLLMKDELVWGFGRYEKNGIPIKGMTYYILDGRFLERCS